MKTHALSEVSDRVSTARAERGWLGGRRFAILAAALLSLPALRLGLGADDLLHRAVLLHHAGALGAGTGPLSLFSFASGTPEDHARAVESGLFPWWTSPDLRIVFFRPLSALTHALDYALWPSSPRMMHLQSVLWYVAAVALASALYRRWLGPSSARWASVATLFYALDPSHGMPVGWIANRNALVATTFSFAALLFHDAGARADAESAPGSSTRRRALRYAGYASAAALSLALALGAGEAAVACVFYLLGYALFLDPRPAARRVRALAPPGAVALAWAVAYRAGGFGVTGSGVYLDPSHAPLRFGGALLTNAPLLLAAELGLLPDAWPALPLAAKAVMMSVALACLGWAAVVLRRAVLGADERVRRVACFLVTSGALAVMPSTGAMPAGRLLLLPSFGLIGAIALVCAVPGASGTGAPARAERAFRRFAWFVHLIAAPILFLLSLHEVGFLQQFVHGLAKGLPTDSSASAKRLIVVNAPDALLATFVRLEAAEGEGTPPERMLVLAANRRAVHLRRSAERTFVVHADGGFYRDGAELLTRDPRAPLPAGTTIRLDDVTITVTHTTPDGIPDEASFELTSSRELATAYVFRRWQGTELGDFQPPPVGESVAFPGWSTFRFPAEVEPQRLPRMTARRMRWK
jgi:hypothetical protein